MIKGVHIWFIHLPSTLAAVEADYAILSKEEKSRAASYVLNSKKIQFIATRIALKRILGKVIGVHPAKCIILNNAKGAPYLQDDQSEKKIFFSVSHCNNRAVIAISEGKAVGVDLEKIRPLKNLEKKANRILPLKILKNFQLSSKNDQEKMFFKYWTRNEAHIKIEDQSKKSIQHEISHSFPGSYYLSAISVSNKKISWNIFTIKKWFEMNTTLDKCYGN